MGGRPCSFSPRNTYDSVGAAKEQTSGESTNYNSMQGTSLAAGLESTNPSKRVEADFEILGVSPIFQEGDNVDMRGKAYIQKGNSLRMVSGPDFKGDDVEQTRELMVQPTGLDLIDVATDKTEEGVLGVDSSGLDHGMDKAGPNNLKPRSTWTRNHIRRKFKYNEGVSLNFVYFNMLIIQLFPIKGLLKHKMVTIILDAFDYANELEEIYLFFLAGEIIYYSWELMKVVILSSAIIFLWLLLHFSWEKC
ncbi:hypothetical protein CMV_012780 [Castanea mollissima]|uniref:Uncharacterized protein n=1 Tax=Castanea mollissima TaxID=60419 RepID=A0A8J4R9Q3_9ROSI|nr:hypothetical protein CMV_012780 [Castanea mollissima]